MNIPEKKLYWIILWIEFYCEMNEWIIFWFDICHFWWKNLRFVYFGHFLGIFPIWQVSMVPWLLNYLLNWISRVYFELNNILNWILIKAILNRILNESDWVSPTTTVGGEYHFFVFHLNTKFWTKFVKYQISELLEYLSSLFHIQFLRKTSFIAHIAVIPFQKTLIKVI